MFNSLVAKAQSFWFGIRSRVEDETGAVATEYVILLVLIAIAIAAGAGVLAAAINAQFTKASGCISGLPGNC